MGDGVLVYFGQHRQIGEQQSARGRQLRPGANEAAMRIGARPFHRQEHRAAPFAADFGATHTEFNFSIPIVLLRRASQVNTQRQAVACPRAARKSVTYRSLRSLQVAAQVPSAGATTVGFGAGAVSTRWVRPHADCGARPSDIGPALKAAGPGFNQEPRSKE